MINLYRKEHIILTDEADAFGYWRADGAFRLLQDIADTHSRMIGVSREDIMQKINCIWMLGRVALKINRHPRFMERIKAVTWYGPPGKITFPRYVSILSEKGEELAALASAAIVVGMDDWRIVLPSKINLGFPPCADITPTLAEPKKIKLQKKGIPKIIYRTPLYSDVDINGHMNNTRYASWIMDLFSLQWHEKYKLKELTIGYSKEAKPGQDVKITLYQDDLYFEVLGIDPNMGNTIFEAVGCFM